MAGESQEVAGRTEVGRVKEVSEDPCIQLVPRYFCLCESGIKYKLQSPGTHLISIHLS